MRNPGQGPARLDRFSGQPTNPLMKVPAYMAKVKLDVAESAAAEPAGEERLTRQMAARRRLEQHQEERRLRALLDEVFEDGLWARPGA